MTPVFWVGEDISRLKPAVGYAPSECKGSGIMPSTNFTHYRICCTIQDSIEHGGRMSSDRITKILKCRPNGENKFGKRSETVEGFVF
jgi:hypothetical protein